MIVFVDRIFIINFITDFVLLHISCGFSGKRNLKSTALAAAFGAFYAVFMYIPSVKILYSLPFKLLFSASMVFIAARPKRLNSFVKALLCFSAVSMFSGGGVFAVLLMSGYTVYEIMNNSIPVFDAKTPVLLLAFGIVAMFCHAALCTAFKAGKIKSKTVNVEIKRGNRRVKTAGLVDTGCTLCEPNKNKPVIIVDYRIAGDFVKETSDICLIPYSTVDSSGVFMGFYPDYIKIGKKIFRDVAVAVCYTEAMNEKQYSAIINSEILKEESCVA